MIKTMFLFCIMLMTFSCASKNGPGDDSDTTTELPTIDKPPVDSSLIAWDGNTSQEVTLTGGDTYEISHPNELAWIAEQSELTGSPLDFDGKIIKFTSDINMDNQEFNGIATFKGTIDGGGKTLYGLHINKNTDNTGFIDVLADGGIISNLTIADSTIKGTANVGAFVGKSTGTTIISGAVNSQTDVTGSGDNIGGIVGFNNSDSMIIELSASSGEITGQIYVGGIIGLATGNSALTNVGNLGHIASGHAAGGIIGGISTGNYTTIIEKAGNSGAVAGTYAVGGIIGYDNARNDAAPSIINHAVNYANVTGYRHIAGAVGITYHTEIEDFGNSGSLIGNNFIGGIIGYLHYNSSITGNAATVKFAYNYYEVPTGAYKKPMIGYHRPSATSVFTDSYFLGNAVDGGTGYTGITAAEFKDRSTFANWDFSTVWTIGQYYPVLE